MDLRYGGRQRLQPETGWLGGRGSMAPFSKRREGISDEKGSWMDSRRVVAWWLGEGVGVVRLMEGWVVWVGVHLLSQ